MHTTEATAASLPKSTVFTVKPENQHNVTGMTQSEAGAKRLVEFGAVAVQANAFDAAAVEAALRKSGAEVVIDELTSLPKNPADLSAALPGDSEPQLEGGGNLHRAAEAFGVRRYIQQSSVFS